MSEITYRDAHAALVNFVQGFAAPMVALLPVLEKLRDAEDLLVTLQPQIDDKTAELAEKLAAVEAAKADRAAVLDRIEHDRAVKQDDADRHLAAYQLKIQTMVDELSQSLADRQAAASAEMALLDAQIDLRKTEQRELDAAIVQKQLTLRELSGKLHRVTTAVEG